MKQFGLFLLMLSLTLCGSAQESIPGEDAGEASAPSSRGQFGGRSRRGGMEAMQKMQTELKEKFPAEYAEIEKLRETDRRAAFEKTRALAEKAGMEMPSFGRGRGRTPESNPADSEEWKKLEAQLKEKFPTEYAEIEKLRQTDRKAAMEKLRALAEKAGLKPPERNTPVVPAIVVRDLARQAVIKAEEIVKQKYPKEYAEMVKLREDDPDAAREQFRALVKKANINVTELKQQIIEQRNQ